LSSCPYVAKMIVNSGRESQVKLKKCISFMNKKIYSIVTSHIISKL